MRIKRFTLSAQVFIFAVSLYFAFALNFTFWRFVFDKVRPDSLGTFVFAVSLPFFIFIPLFLFFSLITLPKIGKPLIVVLLLLSAAADYAMSDLGIVIDSDMVRNFAETNMREALDYVTLRSAAWVIFRGGLPVFLVLMTDIKFGTFAQEVRRRLAFCLSFLLLLCVFAATSYKEYASFGRNNNQVRRYINTFNYIYAVGRYYQKKQLANREFVILDEAPVIEKSLSGAPRLLVLVIGETARAGNFSLYGYERETNPRLAKQDIVTFLDVSSCGTATAISLPCLFSASPRSDFDVTDARFTQNLLDIAKAAGYDVFWKDNDDGCKGVCERVNTVDAKTGNKQPFCFGSYCHDDILTDGLEERIGKLERDTIIVLHMMGSHGPTYFKRYPESFRRFLPACDTADLQNCTREQIINTYDNTILYTDYVVSSVIDILKKYPELESSMIYVSDHGESLGENNIYLHGLPYAIAPEEQKKVPMILWLSQKLRDKTDYGCLQKKGQNDRYSHDNFYHSVLRLAGIKSLTYNSGLDWFENCGRRK